jgi:hypothetical protein
LRPAVAAPTSGHIDTDGRASGDVDVCVVVATGANSKPSVASGGTSGAAATNEAARWHNVAASVTIGGGRRHVVVAGDTAATTNGVAGTTAACAYAGWRAVASIRKQRVTASGVAHDAATADVTAAAVGLAAAGVGSRRAASVGASACGHRHVASGRAAGGAYAFARLLLHGLLDRES